MIEKKIVVWAGNAFNHKALACKISAEFNLAGIVVDNKKNNQSSKNFRGLYKKVVNKLRFSKIDKAWHSMQNYYAKEFPSWPKAPLLHVDSINDKDTLQFTTNLNPDLIVVSGTSLVKEPLVSLQLPIGIINLHTGLSPYVKGGPNCTNWCIANNEWSLIGNTIMWLSSGIDSGNIITTEQTAITHCKSLSEIHLNVMEHAHDLYIRAIRYVINSEAPFQSVPQKLLGKGNLYLTKMWTASKKKQLLKNMQAIGSKNVYGKIATINLPNYKVPHVFDPEKSEKDSFD